MSYTRRNSLKLFLQHPRTSLRWLLEDIKNRGSSPFWGSRAYENSRSLREFKKRFKKNLRDCDWSPHPQYSVFTQYDQDFYLGYKDAFTHKYRCFYAISKTICPRRIVELGTHAGSGADAYTSAAPNAEYIGIDSFEDGVMRGIVHQITGQPWEPRKVAQRLFEARGFKKYELIKTNLRTLEKLPVTSDFVVVDAAHDFENEYADLQLALTANPTYIFVDDIDAEARPAIEKFIQEDLKNRVEFFYSIDYIGGGLVIKLK